MAAKASKGLGRGLSALIPNYVDEVEDEGLVEEIRSSISDYDVDKIHTRSDQPRKYFDPEKLKELAESIKTYGVLQPVLLTPYGDEYLLVAGERRFRAAIIAGLKAIPGVVRQLDEKDMTQLALIENIQREDLNAIEVANGYARLKDEFEMSQEDIARIVGLDRSTVANSLRLLSLAEEIQNLIISNQLSAGHARAVLSLEIVDKQVEFARFIVAKDLSVRESERMAKTYGQKVQEKPHREDAPHIIELAEQLSGSFGTKVVIKNNAKTQKGKIEIEYYSNEDLERIIERLALEA